MADNLKVNAKTKILTFKKKHNLLVENDKKNLKIRYVDNDIDLLSSDFVNELKLGDKVYSESDETLYEVVKKTDDECSLETFNIYDKKIYKFIYTLNGDEWQFDISEETDICNHLYMHYLRIIGNSPDGNYSYHIHFLSRDDKALDLESDFLSSEWIIMACENSRENLKISLMHLENSSSHEELSISCIGLKASGSLQGLSFYTIPHEGITTFDDAVSLYL